MKLQLATINLYLQYQLERRDMAEVTAVEAAKWLSRAQILKDSDAKPGLPLRELLRAGEILGQRQAVNNRWFISHVHMPRSASIVLEER